MSGHKKCFDENISGLPDLTLEVDPEKMVAEDEDDELILEDDTPPERFMKPSEIFIMREKEKEKKRLEQKEMERKMENEKLEKVEPTVVEEENIGVSRDEEKSSIELEIKDKPVERRGRGKRGKDKVRRKRKEMTEAQKASLAKARLKSLEVRKAKAAARREAMKPKKTEPIPIPKPEPIAKPEMSFDYFCNLMDRYEERKKKKVAVSQEPHPNKKIPHHQKPRPPVQKVQRKESTRRNRNMARENIQVTPQMTDFSAYSILKNRNKNVFNSTWGY